MRVKNRDLLVKILNAIGYLPEGLLYEHTATGNPATFKTNVAKAMELSIPFTPVQDLHGYDYPWPGGAGKNKLPTMSAYDGNPSVTVNADGSVLINGSNSGSSAVMFAISNDVEVAAGVEYILSGCPSGGGLNSYRIDVRKGSDTSDAGLDPELQTVVDIGSGATFTPTTTHNVRFAIRVAANATVSNKTFYPMLRLSSVSDATYAPYENKCPITGFTGCNIIVSPTLDAQDGTTYSISWQTEAGTAYGGTLIVNKDGTGLLVVDRAVYTIPEITTISTSTTGTGKNVSVSTDGKATRSKTPIFENVKGVSFDDRGQAWTGNVTQSSGNIMIFVPSDLTVEQANTVLQGSKLVIWLSSPVPYPLTAEEVGQILSLKGENNIWADTNGTNTIKYMKRG